MTDAITFSSPSLAAFLDRLGLPQAARDRVVEIDRTLAEELESDNPDADGYSSLVLEAADLVSDRLRPLLPPLDGLGFDFGSTDWGSDEFEDEEIDDV